MTSAKANDLDRAIELHKRSQLDDAIRAYERFLKVAPEHPGALNLLGIAYSQKGDPARAVPVLERALALRPDLPGGAYNLGTLLHGLKRHEQAIVHFKKAVVQNPSDAEAHNSLASAFNSIGNVDDAVAHFEKAISLRPDYAAARYNFAKLLFANKIYDRAVTHYQAALSCDPGILDAYFGLSDALRELERADEAVKVCERAVSLWPNSADAYTNLGAALDSADRFEEAILQQNKAIEINPDLALAHFNIACCYYARNKYEPALNHYERALSLKLADEAANQSRIAAGWCLYYLGRSDEAYRALDTMITAHGEDPDGLLAKRSKAVMLLNRGNFSAGWALYESRPTVISESRSEQTIPRWNGNPINGTLWVWGEQGLGDHILYASMIDDARERVGSLLVETDARLVPLFARSFPEVIAMGESPSEAGIEARLPMASLGGYFRTDWSSFPKRKRGYLQADPTRVTALRSRLLGENQKIVGLSWRSVRQRFGPSKTAQLADFLQILRLPGIRFIDLQYGDTAEERAKLERETGIAITKLDDIDNTNDIDGLAALISACDVVVSVSNTNAHLAGALGRPTWVFAPFGFSQFWYWFPQMAKSPWYPRVQVRHRTEGRSWESIISPTAAEIETFVKTPGWEP